tara:strand:+ start:2213 stop:2779 length:567 start_codon:yes stop_codon:yes gene_type:complete
MIPEPTQKDIEWAYRLWNGLAIGGTWTLPDVGVYVRVDQNVLALGIIHNSKPSDDAFGQSVFDRHDWIVGLGELLQWNVIEQIQEAYDEEQQQIRINPDDVGNVSLCQARCGAILRVEELVAGVQYLRISDEGQCPLCGEIEAIDEDMRGLHVVIDSTAYDIKQKKLLEKSLMDDAIVASEPKEEEEE